MLNFNGLKLIRHAITEALSSGAAPIIVVLGANRELIANEISFKDKITISINETWKEGMASSIRKGIARLQKTNTIIDGAILMVCDQPHVHSSLLKSLYWQHQHTGKPVIACSYETTLGTPAFFHRSLFPELLLLEGDAGAKKVIMRHKNEIVSVDFPLGNIDIDTMADYESLID